MSLKKKLNMIFFAIVSMILIFGNLLHYFSTKEIMIKNQERDLTMFAQQLGVAIEYSEEGARYIEDVLGSKLRIAAIVAKERLNPDIDQVTNEELIQLSKELGISHITLFKQVEDDIVGLKSSDPRERNLSSKEWDYWYTAFQQLFEHLNVSIPEGQKLPNFWAGPVDVAASDPSKIAKWGYYYDGSTNYIINPYMYDEDMVKFLELMAHEMVINRVLTNNEYVLEVTGFNPRTFGKEPLYTKQNGQTFVGLANQSILFGSYHYQLPEKDADYINKALDSKSIVSYRTTVNNTELLKSFIPIDKDGSPYVIGVSTDYRVIGDVLQAQLLDYIIISVIAVLLVIIGGYFLSEYIVNPIQLILNKVNEISAGNFKARLKVDRTDELGLLSERVNIMSQNLEDYRNQEELFLKSEKLSVVGQLAAGVAHEIRNPLTALLGFTHMLKENTDDHRYLNIMVSELNRIESIVSELLMLSKPQAIRFKKMNVVELLDNVITLLDTQAILSNIEIKTEWDSHEIFVLCDENQIKQVFINLLKNAIEAMPDGGRIQLESETCTDRVLLRVIDQGSGIPEERLAKLGEPFYTTKEKGTGLGLMICQKIIHNHQGKMDIQSEVGKGTTVEIVLPIENGDQNL